MVLMNQNHLQPLPLAEGASDPEVRLWLRQHGKLSGAGLVLHLQAHPDHFYHVSDLADIVFNEGILLMVDHGDYGRLYEEKIPMTDHSAISDCRTEMKRLLRLIAAALTLGLDDVAEQYQRDFKNILDYLKETRTPSGAIRNFPSQEMRDYQRLFQAFRRVLLKARAESYEVYSTIKLHVKTGTTFAWLTNANALSRKRYKAERTITGLGAGNFDL